eukprot:jgi/Ulvmu1/6142/UM277_0001.1
MADVMLFRSVASLVFSIKYAAPELIQALEAGDTTIIVDAAVDVWAIGVIAFELLTGERICATQNVSAVQDALAGRSLLPWEGSGANTEQQLGKLRGLRRSVLRCLQRDPTKRPTAAALVRSWDHTFDNMQTQGAGQSGGLRGR